MSGVRNAYEIGNLLNGQGVYIQDWDAKVQMMQGTCLQTTVLWITYQ